MVVEAHAKDIYHSVTILLFARLVKHFKITKCVWSGKGPKTKQFSYFGGCIIVGVSLVLSLQPSERNPTNRPAELHSRNKQLGQVKHGK